jgi:D-amino-acid oxidase
MEELRKVVRGFRHDQRLIRENGVNSDLGLRDAYQHLAPMIDTDVYLKWLLAQVEQSGCRIIERTISGSLHDRAAELAELYGSTVIVNCTGLGARDLTGDSVYPLRGALIRVANTGETTTRITQAHCVSHDVAAGGSGFIFIVPRGDDRVVLGGIAEPNECNLDIGLHNYRPIQEMYQRCIEFLPALRNALIDAAEPIRVGLRPARVRNVRLEIEVGTPIIHNYGHGGSGVTYSWGCANEVVRLVGNLLDVK